MFTYKLDDIMAVPFSPWAIYSPIPNHKGLTEKDVVGLLPGKFRSYIQFLFGSQLAEDELFLGYGYKKLALCHINLQSE